MVYFYCDLHPEYGEQKIREDSLKGNQNYCRICQSIYMKEHYSGENSATYKGAQRQIKLVFRNSLSIWVKHMIEKANYKCSLTGEIGVLEVHHLQNFEEILNIISRKTNIPVTNDMKQDDVITFTKELLHYHFQNDIGIVLHKDVHKLFHKIYGVKNTTREQFVDFAKSYENYDKKNTNYLPVKKSGTSKFIGVCKNENKTCITWSAHIIYNHKQIYIGSFPTEYRAAKAYNEKAIELKGEFAELNDLSGLSDYWRYEDTYYYFSKNASSIYNGVYFSNGNWRYTIDKDNKRLFNGTANSELEAAYLYNLKKKELLGENVLINFLTEEEDNIAKERLKFKYEYYEHKTNYSTIYTNVFPSGKKWGTRININGKLIVLSNTCLSDKEAAQLYNNYVLENKLERKLNKII